MKYIKNISELKSSTYKSAANALKKHGHVKRVKDLEDWANKLKIDEVRQLIDDFVNRIDTIGTFDLIINGVVGTYYLYLKFDAEVFEQSYMEALANYDDRCWLNLIIGILPCDDSYLDKIDGFKDGFKDSFNYFLDFIGDISIDIGILKDVDIDDVDLVEIYLNDKNSHKLPSIHMPNGKVHLDRYNNNWLFKDRLNASKFRKAIIDIFNGNVVYNKTVDRPGGLKEDVMDYLMSENSYLDIDQFEDWIRSLSRINVNTFYSD